MRAGAIVVDPATTWIDADVSVGTDTVIHPNSQVLGATTIGAGAVIGAQVAYLGNRRFTFGYRGGYGTSWLRFQITALFGALQGMAVVAAAVALGMHYLVAQVLATITGLLLTFAINRAWTFR